MIDRDRLSVAFAALADPTRRDILVRLRQGSLSVSELAGHYKMSRPAVSQHLAKLERAGLVIRDRRAQWHDSSLATNSLDEVASWVEQQRSEWNERFDLLEQHLETRRNEEDRKETNETKENK